ncbi:MAG TPA: TetR/AcrR family transcriptional regulator [Anaerolineales bacterium]|nr:TetR/AcrR family transcriptional regulator [Anaerolineales bacterium]
MARIIKPAEHSAKRNEILDAAYRIVVTRGFDEMTIGDLLTELKMSKGAFYHYFRSKSELLEAMITRMREEAEAVLAPIVENQRLSALDKLLHWFDAIARWKSVRKGTLLSLLRIWYDDDNALVRQKLRRDTLVWMTPMLCRLVRQGIEEGTFSTRYPDQVAHVLYGLFYDLGDALAGLLLSSETNEASREQAKAMVGAYTDALERALGAPRDSLVLVDTQTMEAWFG